MHPDGDAGSRRAGHRGDERTGPQGRVAPIHDRPPKEPLDHDGVGTHRHVEDVVHRPGRGHGQLSNVAGREQSAALERDQDRQITADAHQLTLSGSTTRPARRWHRTPGSAQVRTGGVVRRTERAEGLSWGYGLSCRSAGTEDPTS